MLREGYVKDPLRALGPCPKDSHMTCVRRYREKSIWAAPRFARTVQRRRIASVYCWRSQVRRLRFQGVWVGLGVRMPPVRNTAKQVRGRRQPDYVQWPSSCITKAASSISSKTERPQDLRGFPEALPACRAVTMHSRGFRIRGQGRADPKKIARQAQTCWFHDGCWKFCTEALFTAVFLRDVLVTRQVNVHSVRLHSRPWFGQCLLAKSAMICCWRRF